MTRLHEVVKHLDTLSDIREIMNAMKNLAIIESRKLDRMIESQSEMIDEIDILAADFNHHFPYKLTFNSNYRLYILIGAERGFCGSFNHQILQHYHALVQQAPGTTPLTITIGQKFNTIFETQKGQRVLLDGASANEEISYVLNRLVEEIDIFRTQYGALACSVLSHDHFNRDVVNRHLLPPFQRSPKNHIPSNIPPRLYLSPSEFLGDLLQQYLFANLSTAMSSSLLAENQYRITHLEGAIRHLDERNLELGRLRRSLRQEEIIEEIEVILLNAQEGDGDLPLDYRRI